ncbi:hypothetical protein BH11PLA2_BH11PLA2_30540 [soil metagenome]
MPNMSNASNSAGKPTPTTVALAGVVLAASYYYTAGISFDFAQRNGTLPLLWPPTGIAVGFLLRFGIKLWPVIFFTTVVSASRFFETYVAMGFGVGNALGVILAVFLLRRYHFQPSFTRRQDLYLLLLAAACGAVVLGCNKALWICGSGLSGWHRYPNVAASWILADFAGVLLVAPVIMTCPQTVRESLRPAAGQPSWYISAAALLIVNAVLFGGLFPTGSWMLGLIFIPFIIVIRSAVLYGAWPTCILLSVVLICLTWSLLHSAGPVQYLSPDVRNFASWGFITAMSFTALFSMGIVGESQSMERRLTSGEANYQALVEDNPALICHFKSDGQLFFANETFRRYFGLQAGMTAGRNIFSVTRLGNDEEFVARLSTLRVSELAETTECSTETTLGVRWFRWTARPVKVSSGRGTEFHAVGLDVTEQMQAEENRRCIEAQAVQMQKLESVGLLADGIAHEFNNLLTAILGNTELAQQILPRHSEALPFLAEVNRSAHRGADLTKQLLNYSMRGGVSAGPLDLSELVRNVSDLISVAVPKRCKYHLELAVGLPLVNADDSRMRQLIMGLVSNAGEAVNDNGGQVFIRTRTVQFDPAREPFALIKGDLTPGPRVLLQVEDQGAGMTGTIRSKAFEPFFTTKSAGRGLGLAAVLGIVVDYGGAIGLCSCSGRGTCVSVLLPLADTASHGSDLPSAHPPCNLCTGIDDTTDTPPEFTLPLPLPPFVKVSGYERSGYSSQVRSRSQRPRVSDF